MRHLALALLISLSASLASAAPVIVTTNPSTSEIRHTITFDATTAVSGLMSTRGLCRALSFVRAGSETITLYETSETTSTGGVSVETFSATSAVPVKLDIELPNFYVSSDGATAGGVLTVSCFPLSATVLGIVGGGSASTVTVPTAGDPWISCENLPDPAFTPVAVTTADDLHDVVTDECENGCILELAAGTYDDTNVTVGPSIDEDIKAGSLDGTDISGEILIRAADPTNPPVLRTEVGNTAAIFHFINNIEMVRLENLILDGRRSEQTEAVFDECTDTTPEDGICDTGTQSFSFAQGVHIRSTNLTNTRACLLNLEIKDTASDGIYLRDAVASTIENVTTTGQGCTTTTCPNVDMPANAENNNVLHMGRGVNMLDSTFVAAVGGNYSDATKQGAQCWGSVDCYIADNSISDIGSGGITMLGSSGFVWRNTVDGIGILYPPNTTTTNSGEGINFTDHDDYTGDLDVEFVGNSVANTHGSGFSFGLLKSPAADSSTITLTGNSVENSCLTHTGTSEAAFRLGDNTDRFEAITATENVATGNRCPYGFRVLNNIAYTADDNVVSESVGNTTGIAYDDVEALDDDGLIVDASINIDSDSVGTLTNCTLNGGATITGAVEGNVTRTNCGPAQVGGSPTWGWDLGDLSAYSSRLDVDWDHSQWANAYDTEEELNAIGWTTVDIANNPCTDLYNNDGPGDTQTSGSPDGRCDADDNTYDFTCAAGGSGSNEDRLAVLAVFTDNCTTSPGGGFQSACNNVFKIAASCTLDVTANRTTSGAASNLTPALYLPYNNYAIIGEDPDTSKILANNPMEDSSIGFGPIIGNTNSGWQSGAESAGSNLGWLSGSTKGDTSITTTSNTSIVYDDGSDGDGVNESSIILLSGTDADGAGIRYQTRVAGISGSGPYTITLTDPIPTTYSGRSSVAILPTSSRSTHVIHLNYTLGFPFLEAGLCTAEASLFTIGPDCAQLFKMFGVNNMLLQGMNLGPYGRFNFQTRDYQFVTRHNTIGPNLHGMRRPNNNNHWENPGGSLVSKYNNVYLEGQIRTTLRTNAVFAAYSGFEYTIPQTVPNANDDATSGNYCDGPSGGAYPSVGSGPERSIYVAHDNISESYDSESSGVGHYLVEASELPCQYRDDLIHYDIRRYGTMFRNRFSGTDQQILVTNTGSGRVENYGNWIANRAGGWSLTSSRVPNALGLYNVDPSGTFTVPSGGGIVFPSSGTGKNYVDASAHDDYATADLPPSLAFRNDVPPSWWCQESGDWDGTWSFAYGDGGDNGGTPRKLPAQIRYEGGTCTPPPTSVDYGTP